MLTDYPVFYTVEAVRISLKYKKRKVKYYKSSSEGLPRMLQACNIEMLNFFNLSQSYIK